MPAWDVDWVLHQISLGRTYREIAPEINRTDAAICITLRNIAPERTRKALAAGYEARLYAGIGINPSCSSNDPHANGAISKGLPFNTARLNFNRQRHYARTRLPWLDASAIEEKAKLALYSRACAEGLTGNGKLPRTKRSTLCSAVDAVQHADNERKK